MEDTDYFPKVPWKTKFTGSLRIVLEADLEIAIANIDVKVVQIFRYVATQGIPNQHIESTFMIGTWAAPGFDDRTLADRKPVCSGPATRDADRADSTEILQSPSPCEFSYSSQTTNPDSIRAWSFPIPPGASTYPIANSQ